MKKPLTLLVSGLLIAICLSAVLLEATTQVLRRAYDQYVLDNRNHYLPCSRWPSLPEVERVLQEHQAAVRKIEQVNPGNAGVEVDPNACPGKADLVIWYATHQNRLAIEGIIGEPTFFGIPYRMQNR